MGVCVTNNPYDRAVTSLIWPGQPLRHCLALCFAGGWALLWLLLDVPGSPLCSLSTTYQAEDCTSTQVAVGVRTGTVTAWKTLQSNFCVCERSVPSRTSVAVLGVHWSRGLASCCSCLPAHVHSRSFPYPVLKVIVWLAQAELSPLQMQPVDLLFSLGADRAVSQSAAFKCFISGRCISCC